MRISITKMFSLVQSYGHYKGLKFPEQKLLCVGCLHEMMKPLEVMTGNRLEYPSPNNLSGSNMYSLEGKRLHCLCRHVSLKH